MVFKKRGSTAPVQTGLRPFWTFDFERQLHLKMFVLTVSFSVVTIPMQFWLTSFKLRHHSDVRVGIGYGGDVDDDGPDGTETCLRFSGTPLEARFNVTCEYKEHLRQAVAGSARVGKTLKASQRWALLRYEICEMDPFRVYSHWANAKFPFDLLYEQHIK